MKRKVEYTVWGTAPNTFPAIPDVLHVTTDLAEAEKVAFEAELAGYIRVLVYKPKKMTIIA